MKILFLVPYPTEGASNRVRVEQYIPFLESRGIRCKVRPFVNDPFYKILYLPHRYPEKIFWFAVCTANRLFDLLRAISYDVVFIHREAYPLGGPFIERLLSAIGKSIIFDFDDSIFIPNTSRHNIYIERFKKPGKVSDIIKLSSAVIAGNSYLKEYAARYNKNVVIIPSSIDTDKYRPAEDRVPKKEVVIGWIGSNTTRDFLYEIKDVFRKLSDRYNNVVFKIIGADVYGLGLDNVINKEWSLKDELEDLRSFDIGIMPMPDNEWTRGKCGFKTILYMASGTSVVCSPVGVNTEIVDEGVTGFLAKTGNEWVEKLSRLIEDESLRKGLGAAGREKVEKRYSVKANESIFYDTIMKVHNAK